MRLTAYRYPTFYANRIQTVNLYCCTHHCHLSLLRSPCFLSQTPKSFPSVKPSKHEDGHFHILHSSRASVALYFPLSLDDPPQQTDPLQPIKHHALLNSRFFPINVKPPRLFFFFLPLTKPKLNNLTPPHESNSANKHPHL